MTNKKQTVLTLTNALAWAGAILATSFLTRGKVDAETSFMLTMFLIAGWFAVNDLLTAGTSSIRRDWACIKRWLEISKKA
ncbi:MAG: hypothetical protein IH995_10560 [Proteobacteria bacterium]|nr:hypothetical protein [Pseudomonadota bacterium]